MTLSNTMEQDEFEVRRRKAKRPLLWLAMVSIVMVFAALTSYTIVAYSNGKWVPLAVPTMFIVSTVLIIVSSIPMYWALISAKKNKFTQVKTGLLLTLILGIAFAVSQYAGWVQLVKDNVYFTGKQSFVSGSLMYLLSFLHLLHLIGGLICLSYGYFKSRKDRYNSNNFLGLQLISTYWHFLDGLWVYLFIFLYILAQ